jgi:hypothetical protein
VPTDPAPFLSTVIVASAALVAIVGGLLIARFVGLDSDQQTSRKLLADAGDRLEIARGRAAVAHANLIRWTAQSLLDNTEVADALAGGLAAIAELRRLAATELNDDELRTMISQAADDVQALRDWLSPVPAMERIRATGYAWENYPRSDMPALNYRQLAPPVFARIAGWLQAADAETRRRAEAERRERAPRFAQDYPPLGGSRPAIPGESDMLRQIDQAPGWIGQVEIGQQVGRSLALPAGLLVPADIDSTTGAGGYDDLVGTSLRASQRVEDLEEELRRLRQQHAIVVRPDARLWWAVGILTAYAIGGVGVPLWVMAQGPSSIIAVRWIFWPFACGLGALLSYVVWYLADLTRTRGPRSVADRAGAAAAEAEPVRTVERASAQWGGTMNYAGSAAASQADPET